MSAQYWICPDCGALLTPFHSHCHSCGRAVSAVTKCLMIGSLGYIAVKALQSAILVPAPVGAYTGQIPSSTSTDRQVQGNLYWVELIPCGHYAWVKGEDPSMVVGINVFCPDCPPDDNFRRVSSVQY